jgi:hypothetical protein
MDNEIKDFEETKKILEKFENEKEALSVVQLSPFEVDLIGTKKDYSKLLQEIGIKKEEIKIETPKIQPVEKVSSFTNVLSSVVPIASNLKKGVFNLFSQAAKKGSELRISLALLQLKTIGVKKQLILVNLPINEQITELEQIIYGLINAEFNQEELKIIKREVEGLYIEVQREKIDLTKLNENERALIEARNNALERAIRLLKGE